MKCVPVRVPVRASIALAETGQKRRRCGTETGWFFTAVKHGLDLLCHDLAKFNAPLVKAVDPPEEPADHRHMLIERQQAPTANGVVSSQVINVEGLSPAKWRCGSSSFGLPMASASA